MTSEHALRVVVLEDRTIFLVPERGNPIRVDARDGRMLYRLLYANETASRAPKRRFDEGHLTDRQLLVMRHLTEHQGRAMDIAAAIGVNAGSVSSILSTLKAMGYTDNDDYSRWSLTAAGAERIEQELV